MAIDEILERILEARPVLHGAGAISAEALRAIARHCSGRTILRSAETGCGSTTLLLSQLSQRHTVFALDAGASVSNVRGSPLLRTEAVTFVEGPSQLTLPRHSFDANIQLALIDGPHGYPFPDLEYYYLYPHLDRGALLILDDLQIRTIHNLFEFLKADAMFRLEDVVRNTAFFTRTAAPVFDPLGDNWQGQGYNRRTRLLYDWRSRLGVTFRRRLRRSLRPMSGCSVEILSPASGTRVSESGTVAGRAKLTAGAHLWILVHRQDVEGWWPQGGGPVPVTSDGSWSVEVHYGDPGDAGCPFEIAAVVSAEALHQRWIDWVRNVKETGKFPPVDLPTSAILAEACKTVAKLP